MFLLISQRMQTPLPALFFPRRVVRVAEEGCRGVSVRASERYPPCSSGPHYGRLGTPTLNGKPSSQGIATAWWWSHWTGTTCNRALELLKACCRAWGNSKRIGRFGRVLEQRRCNWQGRVVVWPAESCCCHRFEARCANRDIPTRSYRDNSLPQCDAHSEDFSS